MQANGRPIDEALRTIELAVPPWEQPTRPISFPHALQLIRQLTDREGPALAFRVISEAGFAEIGNLSRAMLSAPTPRTAIAEAAAAIPYHCSHELIVVETVTGGLLIREQVLFDCDQALRHVEQLYVLAIIRSLCLATGYRGEPLERIEMVPHPLAGLGTVPIGPETTVRPSETNGLAIFVPDRVLDLPFRMPRAAAATGEPSWQRLKGTGSFCDTARTYIRTMFETGSPSSERFVSASGISRRTLQRRLAEEGKTFSELLDEVRREMAFESLVHGTAPIAQIAFELGYSNPPAFYRAVHRWTGMAPKDIRREAQRRQHGSWQERHPDTLPSG